MRQKCGLDSISDITFMTQFNHTGCTRHLKDLGKYLANVRTTELEVTLYFDSPSVDTLHVISTFSVACQQCVTKYSTKESVDCQFVLLQHIINQYSTICTLSQHLLS